MSTFPGLEATILKTLEEEGEMRPPQGRLAQEFFWQAASQLQARGLCVADQRAGVVRRVKKESLHELSLTVAGQQRTGLVPVTDTPALGPTPEPGGEPWKQANLYGELPGGICCQRAAGGVCWEHDPANYPQCEPAPATDLPARLRLLLHRWRAQEEARGGAEGAVYGQCAISLEEVMEECGVAL